MKKIFLLLCITLTFSCVAQENDLILVISPEQLAEKIHEAAVQINKDYSDKNLSIVMVMKGAICVTADLIRHINVPFKLEYLRASSYGYNGMRPGELITGNVDRMEVEGRDILIVDDIFETGNTIQKVIKQLKDRQPKSIKTLLLLVKDVPRQTTYRPDYVLFDIPDLFVIGYGLDYKELYRGLPGVYAFPDNKPPF